MIRAMADVMEMARKFKFGRISLSLMETGQAPRILKKLRIGLSSLISEFCGFGLVCMVSLTEMKNLICQNGIE